MPFLGLGLHVFVALFFAVHAVRTGRQMYWLFILFAFPLLGSVVYFFAEYLPSTRIEQHLKRTGAEIARSLDPGRELRDATKAYEIASTAQNQMRLANALLEAGRFDAAADTYAECLEGPFGAEPDVRVGAARTFLAQRKFAEAASLLEKVRLESAHYRPEEVAVLLAQTYWAMGDLAAASRCFATASSSYNSVDARAEHIIFALSVGDAATARRLQHDIDLSRKTWTSHARKLNREVIARLDAQWAKSGIPRQG